MAETSEDPHARIAHIFSASPFLTEIGIALVGCGPGWCEAAVALERRHTQFTGVAHAGVVATLADHCAGAAAITLLKAGQGVVTSEFKLSLLRGAVGGRLIGRGTVLKSGRLVSFVEADVFTEQGAESTLVARLSATMIAVSLDKRQ